MHDVQTGNQNHGDYHTLFDLFDFKMLAQKQTMICLLNCFIWLNYSSTNLWDFFLLGHLALHAVHLTLTLDFLFKKHRLSQKGHFLTIFEMSGFILAKNFTVRLKGDIHGNDLFSSQDY